MLGLRAISDPAITPISSYPNIGPPRIWNRRLSGSSRVRPALHPHADPRPPDSSGGRTPLHPSGASGSLAPAAHRSANSATSPRTGLARSRPESPVPSRRPRLPARGTREAPVAGPRRPARREQWCRLAWPRRGEEGGPGRMMTADRLIAPLVTPRSRHDLRRPPSRSVPRRAPSVDRGAESSVSCPRPWGGRSRWEC